jgi:hypothetical protein
MLLDSVNGAAQSESFGGHYQVDDTRMFFRETSERLSGVTQSWQSSTKRLSNGEGLMVMAGAKCPVLMDQPNPEPLDRRQMISIKIHSI